jgi:hypothetical protein
MKSLRVFEQASNSQAAWTAVTLNDEANLRPSLGFFLTRVNGREAKQTQR